MLMRYVDDVKQPTPCSRFMSKFRARAYEPLDHILSKEMKEVYQKFTENSSINDFSEYYWETLPFSPPIKDEKRLESYNYYLSRLKLIESF